jgi:hypothetical protein
LQFSTRCALFEMVFSITIDFVLLTNYSKCIFLYRIDVTSITFRGVGLSLGEVSILIVLGPPPSPVSVSPPSIAVGTSGNSGCSI